VDIAVPGTYQGFSWSNAFTLDVAGYFAAVGQTGYSNGTAAISAPNVGFSGFNSVASFSAAQPFTLVSMLLGAGWYDNLTVTVSGSLGGVVVESAQFLLSASLAPIVASFARGAVDTVSIAGAGGTPAGYPGCCTQVYFDDIVTRAVAVPEPASLGLLGAGLLGLGALRRRAAG
jgi:hypothetical protein